jgi:phosphoglycolate phosphatase
VRRLVLWDVDGTLVAAGPAAREAFYRAVSSVLGRAADRDVQMSGKTDPQIALEILARIAVSDQDARRYLPDVLRELERNLESAVEEIRRDGRPMEGAGEVLQRLHGIPGVIQSVLSGNLAANARMKLGAFGLDRWLDLESGAYGSDAEERSELVPIALAHVHRRHGVRFDPGEVWVVGDTTRDLDAARAGGARCLLVATGRFSLDELTRARADAVLADLSDVEEVVRILTQAEPAE